MSDKVFTEEEKSMMAGAKSESEAVTEETGRNDDNILEIDGKE